MAVAVALCACARAPTVDLVIRHASIVDGSGGQARPGDIAVDAGRILAVGEIGQMTGRREVDAAGHTVSPGFIDVHTHADEIANTPGAENFVRMGVTTVVAGNCGNSALRVGEALAKIESTKVTTNYATLIGHNTVRQDVMGLAQRAPTSRELERMAALVDRGMRDGAVGFSTGLEYVPGTYATSAEIVTLARAAAALGGLYASHLRNEGTDLLAAVREAVTVGEATGTRVQISHLKVDAKSRWGVSASVLALIDAARARGVDVRADQYASTAASSPLGIRFPSWVLEGSQAATNRRLADPAVWTRIKREMSGLLDAGGFPDYAFAVVATYEADASLNGLSLPRIADKTLGRSDLDAQQDVARHMLSRGGASMVYHVMNEDDVRRIMRHPHVAFASDSSVQIIGRGTPHPRGYGNTARILGTFVREESVLSLEEAVRKMTSLPAAHFGLVDRGRIEVGYAADLVIFDPARVGDAATFERPHQYPRGISDVIVNGESVVQHGAQTSARPGRVLRGPAVRP